MTVINGKTLLAKSPIKGMASRKLKAHGTSYGLGEAGYDIRIKQEIVFYPDERYQYLPVAEGDGKVGFKRSLLSGPYVLVISDAGTPTAEFETKPGRFTLASAIEEFDMPANLVGVVHDKSTWARQGLSVFNTVIEPGFKGGLTLELVFHGNKELIIPAGVGIAQVIFTTLAHDACYEGKYNGQSTDPTPSIFD